MENISVTVNILERSYKLSIAAEEEKHLRDAAALIDAHARMFKKQFVGIDVFQRYIGPCDFYLFMKTVNHIAQDYAIFRLRFFAAVIRS